MGRFMRKTQQTLTRKQQRAIETLISESTLLEAAQQAGVGYTTLKRWRKLPAFQDAERAARREILDRTVSQLLAIRAQAVATLKRALDNGESTVEVRAALAVLEHGTKGVETLDLLYEIESLKRQIAESRHVNNRRQPRVGQVTNG